jgi:hypothetical protein
MKAGPVLLLLKKLRFALCEIMDVEEEGLKVKGIVKNVCVRERERVRNKVMVRYNRTMANDGEQGIGF